MRYAVARYNEYRRETAYRVYVTDCLCRMAVFCGADKSMPRYADLLKPQKPTDNRSGDEILADIVARAGLEVTD